MSITSALPISRESNGAGVPAWSKEAARATMREWKQTGLLAAPILYGIGAKIIEQGTESGDVFLLERGVAGLEREQTPKDRSGMFALCFPGSLLGQSSDSSSHSSAHSAIALTQCSVYRISRIKILEALQEGGEPALFIIRQYLQNLLQFRARVTESTVKPVKVRFEQFLLELAAVVEERNASGSIRLPLKDKEFAGLLGISPQQFCVIKKEMEVEKVITCSGQRNRLGLRSGAGKVQFFKVHRYKRISNIA